MSRSPLYEIQAKTITGEARALSDYSGKVLLIVNVASRCGFTPQYEGLERLYQTHRSEGLEVLGFPCNQFGHQEPGGEAEIQAFCTRDFGVTFPLFAKVEVNGPGAHPLYRWLRSERKGFLGTSAIKWNFTKFLVDRQGCVIKRFSPYTAPVKLESEVQRLLGT